MIRETTNERMKNRVDNLSNNFALYLNAFDATGKFSGPSIYFHERTLKRLTEIGLSNAIDDLQYLEYLYATLASWGLHRMGPKGAKLVSFKEFGRNLHSQKQRILSLQNYRLSQLTTFQLNNIMQALWEILSQLKISQTGTQLIACSKTLHHLLPNLMPPIDREHTIRFFYYPKGAKQITLPYGGEKRVFDDVFPQFFYLSSTNQKTLSQHIGTGFNTSETKVVDNAIMGFAITDLKFRG